MLAPVARPSKLDRARTMLAPVARPSKLDRAHGVRAGDPGERVDAVPTGCYQATATTTREAPAVRGDGPTLRLAEGGRARARIVIDPEASPVAQFAAAELAAY